MGLLISFVGVMWLVVAFDWLTGDLPLGAYGIIPRSSSGLAGILAAPFLHGGLEHLLANTIPLVVLGLLILARGANQFLIVGQISILVAGAGTWLFGSSGGHHIGASGIVFGFIGFLLFRSVFDRRASSFVITGIVAIAFGATMLSSLVPAEGISWSGHFFGLVGGIAAAFYLRPKGAVVVSRELIH